LADLSRKNNESNTPFFARNIFPEMQLDTPLSKVNDLSIRFIHIFRKRIMRFTILPLILCILSGASESSAQIRELQFYTNRAYENNPEIRKNTNLQEYYRLNKRLQLAPFRSPQVNFTADYLFAPFFFDHSRFLSVTTNPEDKAFGYDVSLSNGGLYAAQFNASLPLLSGAIRQSITRENDLQNEVLQNSNNQLVHELTHSVVIQYISVYRLQQQAKEEQKIIELAESRKQIVGALVEKGLLQQNDYLLLDIEIKQRLFDIQKLNVELTRALNELNNTCGISDTIRYELIKPDIKQDKSVHDYNFRQKFELDSTYIISQENSYYTKYKTQLNAFCNAGLNASDAVNIPHNTGLSAGLHLLIPIYDGNQKKIVQQQNRILISNLQENNLRNDQLIRNNLLQLQSQIIQTEESISLLDSQISTQERLLQIINQKVVTGLVSVTDYLNALQQYATNEQIKIQEQANLLLLISQYNYTNW
jgi:outer membrane protein TolC